MRGKDGVSTNIVAQVVRVRNLGGPVEDPDDGAAGHGPCRGCRCRGSPVHDPAPRPLLARPDDHQPVDVHRGLVVAVEVSIDGAPGISSPLFTTVVQVNAPGSGGRRPRKRERLPRPWRSGQEAATGTFSKPCPPSLRSERGRPIAGGPGQVPSKRSRAPASCADTRWSCARPRPPA